MPKFRFYMVSFINGDVTGTNNEELARQIAGSDDDFVVDTETNLWLQEEGEAVAIAETSMKKEDFEEQEQDAGDQGG